MINVLSSSQMKELDSRTIREFNLPARVLMENAGQACARIIQKSYGFSIKGGVLVLCGTGNNGGDGAVIARWLSYAGIEVTIFQIGKGRLSPESKANLECCRALNIPVIDIDGEKDLTLVSELIESFAIVVDAIYGIGFKGEPLPWISELFEIVSDCNSIVVSVDIPSGLDADTGFAENCVMADATLCIESYKLGNILGEGRVCCGDIIIVPIGIPSQYYEDIKSALLFTEDDFNPPLRNPYAHKNDYGRVYIFGGIPGYTGASVMSAQAALRSGAGYAYVLHRMEMIGIYANKLTEALSLAIPEDSKTGRSDSKALLHLLSDADAVLIGPGLGRDDYALQLLEIVLKHVKQPLVVDADGINLISENPALKKYLSKKNLLLTPHWGEFARLAGIEKDLLDEDCLTHLKTFVASNKARVLLKSHYSIYHDGELTLINTSGNDGLATGGSGDVLAGIIVSFLGQGLDIPNAAINAAYLLGKTAEELAKQRGTASIIPTDIINHLFVQNQEQED